MCVMITLSAGGATAIIDVERGGRLFSLRIDGQELLLGVDATAGRSIGWGCFVMAPWPGRLAGGQFRWRGRRFQVPQTLGRDAIHGLVHDRAWQVEDASGRDASLSIELGPAGWPFAGRVRERIALEERALVLEASIDADEPMPAAIGWHPWFLRRGADPRVEVAAASTLALREMIPTGARHGVRGRTDLREGPALGRRRLDDVYVDARSPATIRWPDLELRIEFEPPLSTVVVHTPVQAICVEPQTAWPNALSGDAVAGLTGAGPMGARAIELDGGQALRTRTKLTWRELVPPLANAT
jgi:aldose 1-epimerase